MTNGKAEYNLLIIHEHITIRNIHCTHACMSTRANLMGITEAQGACDLSPQLQLQGRPARPSCLCHAPQGGCRGQLSVLDVLHAVQHPLALLALCRLHAHMPLLLALIELADEAH